MSGRFVVVSMLFHTITYKMCLNGKNQLINYNSLVKMGRFVLAKFALNYRGFTEG